MKWLGVLLFIFTTTWIGFEWSRSLNERPKHIRQLKNALRILEAEMMYSQLPLKEAFRSIAKQLPYPTNSFFQQLSDGMHNTVELSKLWNEEIETFTKNSAISTNEKEVLKQFGQTLGQHDFIQQQKQIQLAMQHLDRELEEASDNHRKYGKMAKSLGFLSGLFIGLLFI